MSSNKAIRSIIDNISEIPIIICDKAGKIIEWNKGASQIFGYEYDDVEGKIVGEILGDELNEDALKDGSSGEDSKERKVSCSHKSGKKVNVKVIIEPLNAIIKGKKAICIIGKDYSGDEKVANLKTKGKDKRKLEFLFDNALVGVLTHTAGKINFVNKAVLDLTGYTYEEAIGKNILDFIPEPDDRFLVRENMEKRLKGEQVSASYPVRIKSKDGSDIYVELTAGLLSKKPPEFFVLLVNISNEMVIEKQADMILTKMKDGVIIHEERMIRFINPSVCEIFNCSFEDVLGKDILDLSFCDEDKNIIDDKINELKEGIETGPYRVRLKDKESIKFLEINSGLLSFSPYTEVMVLRDMTAEKELQREKEEIHEQLWQTGKLAALGELASSVVHEVNNPLMGIVSYAQLVLEKTDEAEENYEYIRAIITEADHINQLVRNLLTFSRQKKQERRPADVNEIIEAVLLLMKHRLEKDGITIKKDLDEATPLISAKKSQIEEVFINIVSNAHYALNKKYENKILELRTSAFNGDGEAQVLVEFKDYGTGIGRNAINKIFTPFFTTKKEDEGTGLGMSISYDIIEDHGGTIEIETKEGEFTVFKIFLPAFEE